MEYLDWVMLAILIVPILIILGFGWNYIFVESKKEYNLKEKWLLFLVVILLASGIFFPFFIEKQENGFVNIISLSGYLLSVSVVGKYSKRFSKKFSKGCYKSAIILLILAFPYLISVKVNPSLKELWLFNNLENLDATSFSFAIAAMIIIGEVLSKK